MPGKNKRLTIAFFSNPIRPFYGNFNFSEVVFETAREYDASVLWYRGGEQFSTLEGDSEGNRIYRLLDRDMIDGVLLSSVGFKASFRTDQEFMNVMDFLKVLPVVSVGLSFPGIHSVVSDSYTDFMMIMEHMITVHGYKRVALISGPAGDIAMENRIRAYQDALAAHDIPYDPKLVSPTLPWDIYYGKGTGKEAVRILLDERKVRFEAIVAGNDRLAIGAYEELERRGIHIPEDVALTGYDNEPNAKALRSPLTTVPHPQPLMLRKGMSELMDIIHGKEVPALQAICSELVIRRSCGCVPEPVADLIASMPELNPSSASRKTDREFVSRAIAADSEKLCAVTGLTGPGLERLLKKILDVCFDGYDKILLRDFALLLDEYAGEDDFSDWEAFLVRIRQRLVGMLPEMTFRIDNIILVLQNRLAENSLRLQYARLLAFDDVSREVHNFNKLISTARDLPELYDMISRELMLIGIRECYISLFTGPGGTGTDARLVFGFSDGARIQCNPTDPAMVYPANKILPERIIRGNSRFEYFVAPLFHNQRQLGILILSYVQRFSIAYEAFRAQISGSIWGIMMLDDARKAAEQLEAKASELARSNRELEQFAFVASHDLQEPLRKISSFSGRVADEVRGLLSAKGRDSMDRIEKAVLRMQRLIDGLLQYSRAYRQEYNLAPVDLDELAREVVCDLEPRIVQAGATVKVSHLPVVKADLLQMRQLFQNLISNAVKFRKPDTPPEIRIFQSDGPENRITIVFQDNGIGIGKEFHGKIFRIFERLHAQGEYEGSGIGLAICQKIAERHGGNINVESEPGKGTRFLVTLPMISVTSRHRRPSA